MNERMLQILQMEVLTALKFAELMEVQPSSVSHILSGRNKPGFELISKIMQRMPNINPDWLINGIGAPKRDGSLDAFGYKNLIPSMEEPHPSHIIHNNTDITTTVDEQPIVHQNPIIQTTESQASNTTPPATQIQSEEITPQQPNLPIVDSNQTIIESTINIADKQNVKQDSQIERIVIFASDGTFKMYNNKS